jgi:SOS-response transcriptional repressor LexA
MHMAERVETEEQKALRALHFIARREGRGEPSPRLREIGCAAGLESPAEVQGLLDRLTDSGYLLQDADQSRMLRLTDRGWWFV